MKTKITRPTWEDVVFESRNKEYGAYSIRKSYDENVSKALLVALLAVAFVFATIKVASLLHVEIKIAKPEILDGIISPPIIIPEKRVNEQKIKPLQKTSRNLFPIATVQEPVEVPSVEPISTSPLGEVNGTTAIPVEGVAIGISEPTLPLVVEAPKIFTTAEVMPRYEGGVTAMIKFLSKNIHYSTGERSLGHEGTVYVRFVVNSFGQVADVEVIKGVSAMLDREAMRVVVLMTKWKPGLQHDMPVNVRMVLPIRFELGNE